MEKISIHTESIQLDQLLKWAGIIESGGQVFRQDVLHVLVQHLRIGMRGEGVEIGHEVTAVVVVLHAHEVAQGTVIIA